MKKRLKRLILLFSLTAVLLAAAFYYLAPYLVIEPYRKSVNIEATQHFELAEEVMIECQDGIQLATTIIPAQESKGVVILIHGIGGYKESFFATAKQLNKLGISSIAFDLRAHGKSEGEFCTYGAMETEDVRSIVQAAQHRFPNQPIGIWGNSLGGAIAIQSLEKIPELEFGIIESTFADLNDVVLEYQTRTLLGLRSEFLRDIVLSRAGRIANFDPSMIRPEESCKNIDQPVLLIHGSNDQHIPFSHAQRNANNLTRPRQEFYVVPEGLHYGLSKTGGSAHHTKWSTFLLDQVQPDVQ